MKPLHISAECEKRYRAFRNIQELRLHGAILPILPQDCMRLNFNRKTSRESTENLWQISDLRRITRAHYCSSIDTYEACTDDKATIRIKRS